MPIEIIVLLILLVILLLIIICNIKIVPQAQAYVMERLAPSTPPGEPGFM